MKLVISLAAASAYNLGHAGSATVGNSLTTHASSNANATTTTTVGTTGSGTGVGVARGGNYCPPVVVPGYMQEGLSAGSVGFSLAALVEACRENLFRGTRVWQMVTSHLRSVAVNRAPHTRCKHSSN